MFEIGHKYKCKMIDPTVFDSSENEYLIKEFFHTNGYVVISNIASNENMQAVKNKIKDINEGTKKLGFLDFYHDNTLAQLRQDERIFKPFTYILNSEKLWVVFDRVIYQKKDEFDDILNPHVDQNPLLYPDFQFVQGMLALKKMDENSGTLALIPKSHLFFHQKYKKWAPKQGQYIEYKDNDLPSFIGLKLKKGHLVIWDSRTTHSRILNTNSINRKNRYAALISFTYAKDSDKALCAKRIQSFNNGIGFNCLEAGLRATSSPRCEINFRTKKEQLTNHGEKIYGIKKYNNNSMSVGVIWLLISIFLIIFFRPFVNEQYVLRYHSFSFLSLFFGFVLVIVEDTFFDQ